MRFLNDAEKATLTRQIQSVEAGTSAEIVTVIARESDTYRYIPTLWAAMLSLALPGAWFLWQTVAHSGWDDLTGEAVLMRNLYVWQIVVFLGLATLFQVPAIRMLLIPKSVQRQRAARHAHQQFFMQQLHRTDGNTGILLFVSIAEHYVEIIVDHGIAARVDNSEWQSCVEDFVAEVKQGRIAEGFRQAIEHCRTITWANFPSAGRNADELPNHLIEV